MSGKYAALVLGAVLAFATGSEDFLPRVRDITTVELMQVLALDEGEEGKLRVTAASGVHSGGNSGENKPPVVLTSQASTVFAACMELQSKGNGYASFSHVEQVVLSAQASQRSTHSLLDFLERDPEMRLDTQVYVTQEERAGKTIEEVCSKDHAAAELLEAISREMPVESQAWPVTVRELMTDLEENGCALVPVLEMEKEGEKKGLRSRKMGVFREDDFQQSLTEEESLAAAVLENKLGSGVVELEMEDGNTAGVRLTESRCKWMPRWKGKELAGITVFIEEKGNLAEFQGEADLDNPQVWERLRAGLEEKMGRETEELLVLSQRSGGDFLHLQRRLRMLCPGRYERIDQNWKEWFPKLELKTQVRATIQRSYDLNRGTKT